MQICITWLLVYEIETILMLTSYIGRKINLVLEISIMLTQRANSVFFDSPYNAKCTLEVTYEISLNQKNRQWFYYSLCNNMFNLSKPISQQNFLTMVYYTKLALHKLSITNFNQQWTIVICKFFVAQYYQDFWSASSGTEKTSLFFGGLVCSSLISLSNFFHQ